MSNIIKTFDLFNLKHSVISGENQQLNKFEFFLLTQIDTFINLSNLIGKEKVIWRFDPLILSTSITIEDLISKIEHIGNRIFQYTEKLVFSFTDIESYKKVQSNLSKTNESYREFSQSEIDEFSEKIVDLISNGESEEKIKECFE